MEFSCGMVFNQEQLPMSQRTYPKFIVGKIPLFTGGIFLCLEKIHARAKLTGHENVGLSKENNE